MTLPTQLANHVHVSEREIAHNWPDGRWDNASWEDCFWCSFVEWLRITQRASIPATHAEAEALRAASGEDTGSGSNPMDGNRGAAKRYGLGPFPIVRGTSALWSAMTPGTAACVAGSMGAFPDGHPLRRHDPAFNSGHCIFAARVDAQDRVWWCDPLAPSGYVGEWVSKADFLAFVGALENGGHFVAPLLARPNVTEPPQEDPNVRVVVVTIEPFPAQTFTAVGVLQRYSATAELSPILAGYSATVDGAVTITGNVGAPTGSGFLRLASGGSKGRYIKAAQVVVTP